ncbi:hypothetical protein GCM10023189_27240 [Nibrella saemangeumensis]|uniref:histidine kinase n=2 Tax=Nibrella saemangeumensis TaxID=1084526 RepID=A0ABP8MXM8_9BACT
MSVGQAQTVLRIDSLPPQGLLLDKGWLWHEGDNPDWANPTFDDSQWERIDPAKDIMELPQVRKAGIGWLRLHLQTDSSLVLPEALILLVRQMAASELYINGRFSKRFGTVSPNPDQVEAVHAYFQQVSLPAPGESALVLAVRIAWQPGLPYNRFAAAANSLYGVTATTVSRLNSYIVYRNITNIYVFSKVGVFFILALLHVLLYIFYPPQRANLFFSISSLVFFHHWLGLGLWTNGLLTDSGTIMYLGLIRALLYPVGYVFLVTALYSAYAFARSIYYRISLITCVLLAVIYWTDYQNGVLWIEIGSTIVMTAEALRVTVVAVRKKQRGATIILIGMVLSLIGLSLRYLLMFTPLFISRFPFSVAQIYSNSFETFGTLCIPLSLSVYLATEFAFTSKSLAAQLAAVKLLSAQTLAQEQEKQLMLTQQNETLESKVTERTAQLQQSLDTLKTTQAQLIQKEKMASLGELTAGIAHEIQNPLNFVNNFAEVSVEMTEELRENLQKGNITNAVELSEGLGENMSYIVENGKRAASIVRSMLEHSRSSSGERRPTNLNELAEEYLKLAYHGIRAQDPDFQVQLCTQFDDKLQLVTVAPQDIGRVLLNLYNNAFYAVRQKQQQQDNGRDSAVYQPQVTVSIRADQDAIALYVKDNGTGIPSTIVDKIYQPFFTTKPTGQGTGLGLSLSYDIITRGHGGDMRVESCEGEGTEFVIHIPLN